MGEHNVVTDGQFKAERDLCAEAEEDISQAMMLINKERVNINMDAGNQNIVRLWGGKLLVITCPPEALQSTISRLTFVPCNKFKLVEMKGAGPDKLFQAVLSLPGGVPNSGHIKACTLCGDTYQQYANGSIYVTLHQPNKNEVASWQESLKMHIDSTVNVCSAHFDYCVDFRKLKSGDLRRRRGAVPTIEKNLTWGAAIAQKIAQHYIGFTMEEDELPLVPRHEPDSRKYLFEVYVAKAPLEMLAAGSSALLMPYTEEAAGSYLSANHWRLCFLNLDHNLLLVAEAISLVFMLRARYRKCRRNCQVSGAWYHLEISNKAQLLGFKTFDPPMKKVYCSPKDVHGACVRNPHSDVLYRMGYKDCQSWLVNLITLLKEYEHQE